MKKKFEYEKAQVNDEQIFDMHIRGSSAKDRINVNKKLVAFFLHSGSCYFWCEGRDMLTKVTDTISVAFDRIDDEDIFLAVRGSKKEVPVFKYMEITVEFSIYKIEPVFEEKMDTEEIKAFGFDQMQKVLILFKKKKFKKKQGKYVKIVDLLEDENKVLYNARIQHPELVGRLKSMLYSFVDGHLYYNNSVIKIRYDLLRSQKTMRDLDEQEVFDFYNDILHLEKNEKVQMKMPMA